MNRNVRGGLVLLPLGLLAGLAMSLYAFQPLVTPPAGLDRYDDLPRRLLRLGHIAAIMLPLINIVVGPWIDRLALGRRARGLTSGLLLFGAAALPAALWIQAFRPELHLAALPAVAFTAGASILALGALPRSAAP